MIIGCRSTSSASLESAIASAALQHPVAFVRVEALRDSLSKPDFAERFVLFDVRTIEEYDTSHLDRSIRVDPMENAAEFARKLESFGSKKSIFYCSVGFRSSAFVEKLIGAGVDSSRVMNLRGGIFAWYNEGQAVYDSSGVTGRVHPYDPVWGRLLEERAGATRYAGD